MGGTLLASLALGACTHARNAVGEAGSPTRSAGQPTMVSAAASPNSESSSSSDLRPCTTLVGSPTYAAIIGMAITCSLGTPPGAARDLVVTPLSCPDGAPIYVFYSNSPDASDKAVYFGSETGPLYSTSRQDNNAAMERTRVCPSGG